MTKADDIINSQAISKAFYGIIMGNDYSHSLSNCLGISQPAALKSMGKLKSAKLITPRKLEGKRIVRYYVNWNQLSRLWILTITEIRTKNIKASPVVEAGRTPVGKATKIEYENERNSEIILKAEAAASNKFFELFTQRYFETLADFGYEHSLHDAFLFFSYEVLPYILSNNESYFKKNEKLKKEFDFFEWMNLGDNSFLGNRVFDALDRKFAQEKK